MSDDDFAGRLRAMRDVPPWMMHLTFDAPLRVQRARRAYARWRPGIDQPCPTCASGRIGQSGSMIESEEQR